ncbi:MAG: hypothetical protein A3H88_01050 [Candidatus Blackburnbacteria bacterium RIFCSPLOWO2_02_FULL_44_9]|nr:MAG: hypothetical protein A3E16_00960 [Candidatus Blackburnbacteria bacterium RIFCSPHIGHO2_12_FULL_44_25]OGY15969.1 MAG: hypothetical protein A3H88_01050 [Candidatus Blackburnbacteria bacterium RIFCSPLOWO2_02_FULL_44_9]
MRFLNKTWPFILLASIVTVFFYPVFLENKIPLPGDFVVGAYYPWLDYKWGFPVGVPVKNPITTDVVSFIYPMQMLAIDLLKNGEWPLWNPYILGGTPLLANFQSAPFSPTNFVYWLFDRLTAWSVQIMLQHLLAGTFTYLLLVHWKIKKLPAVIGATIFAFSGFNMVWSQWNGHALAAAFIPLLLLLEDKWLQSGKISNLILFPTVLAIQIYSGYPQVVLYTALSIILLFLWRFEKSKKYLIKAVMLGVAGLFGLGLAAPQILPGAELLSLSQREVEPHPYEWAFLPWIKTITFLAPDFFGNHATQNYWGPQDYTSNTGFVGVVAATLACAGILHSKNKNKRFAIVLLCISLILSFPTPVSIFFWKTGVFGLQAASAHRALVLFNLGIAILAGFGANTLIAKKISPLKTFLLPTVLLLFFLTVSAFLYVHGPFNLPEAPDSFNILTQEKSQYRTGLRNLAYPTLILLLSFPLITIANKYRPAKKHLLPILLLITCAELFKPGWKFTPFSPRNIIFPNTPVLEFLKNQEKPFRTTGSRVIPINMRMPYKIETLEGYDAVYPLEISQFIAAVTSGRSGTSPVGRYGTIGDETTRVLDLVNVKYNLVIKRNKKNEPSPTGEIPSAFTSDKLTPVFEDGSVAVLKNTNVLPRAFMVYNWVKVDGPEALDVFMDPTFPIDKKIVLADDSSITTKPQPSNKVGAVSYTKNTENESVLIVETEQDGLLFISDTYYPGWKAVIDGERNSILRANFAFRAIPIPKGEHTIRMTYESSSFFNGIKIGIISALLLGGLSVFLLREKNRKLIL